MGKIIGIDLGTTNSAVSIFENGKYKIIPNKEGKNTTPSIVAFTDKGEILVGDTAKRQAITNPKRTISSIKRIMGLKFNEKNTKKAQDKVQYKIVNKNGLSAIQIEDKIYTPQEISAKILSKLKKDAEEFLGEKVSEAIITVPAYFNNEQRQATKEAGIIAGLDVKRIINEPTAAALAYGLNEKKDEKVIIVDVGGGTTDISLLDIGDGAFEVLATDGNAFLGGVDIDNIILKYILKDFKDKEGIDLSNDVMALQRLSEAAENLKKELSSTEESDINLPFITANKSGPKHLNIKMTRKKLEGLIDFINEEILVHIKQVLKDANIKINEINEIIMVGGTTRIPIIQKAISNFFNGKKLNKSVNPDEIVSAGAAVQGGVLSGKLNDVLLLDVTPLSLGIETMGGVVTKLIEKGTTIPVQKSEIFSTAENNQPTVTIHVLQGEREFAKDNKSLGRFDLTGIPPAPRGVPQIEVSFDIDANGILKVSAKDKTTGKVTDITINNSGGLSKDEIEKMINEAELNAEQDKKRKEIIIKRNELDGLCSQIKKQSNEMNIELSTIHGLSELLIKAETLVKEENEDKIVIENTINELQKLVQAMLQQRQQTQCNSSNDNKKQNEEEIIDAEVE